MKNIKRLILLFIFATFICTACTLESEPKNTEILYILGGTPVTMTGKDVVRDITVTALAPVQSRVTVTLSSDAKEGEVIFEHTTLTINEGEDTASTKITFCASKFPLGTPERKITVTASINSSNVHLATPTTDFIVSSKTTDPMLPELIISAKSTTTNTTDGEGIAELTFSLQESVKKDLVITATYDKGLTIDKNDIRRLPEQIIIPKNHTYTTQTIEVKQGVNGIIPLKFTVPGYYLRTESLKFTFVVDPFPNTPTELCALTALHRNSAFTKTFTVGNYTLTPEHGLDGSYGYEDNTKTVTAGIIDGGIVSIQLQNAISGQLDTYTLAAWVDWNRSGKLTDNERVCYKTINAPAQGTAAPPYTTEFKAPKGTADGMYIMRIGTYYNDNEKLNGGCGAIDNGDMMDITINYTAKGDSEISILPNDGTNVYVDDQTAVRTFTVARSIATAYPITLNLSVASTGTDTPILSSSAITIPAFKTSAEGSIIFKGTSSQQTDVIVEIVSASGGTVNPVANKIVYDVTYSSTANIPLVKLCPYSVFYRNYIFTESFTAGDYTLNPKHNTTDKTYGYKDLSATKTANIKNGDIVSITYGNQDAVSAVYISAAWVDWNRDGNVDNQEAVIYREWNASYENSNSVIGTVTGVLKAPTETKTGTYIMRIGSSSKKKLTGGCGKVENGDMFDIKINYTE